MLNSLQCFAWCEFVQDHIPPVVSSIFLRRLLLPGIHHNVAMRATLLDYNRHWSESDFQSLTADGLKKEILSLIEHEVFIVVWIDSFSYSHAHTGGGRESSGFNRKLINFLYCVRVWLTIQHQYFAAGKISLLAISKTGARAMHHVACLLIPQPALLV